MRAIETITVTAIEATPEWLVLVIGKRKVHVSWDRCSNKLASATERERLSAELSPGGYGIHWPLIDEDLSVSGLLRNCE